MFKFKISSRNYFVMYIFMHYDCKIQSLVAAYHTIYAFYLYKNVLKVNLFHIEKK